MTQSVEIVSREQLRERRKRLLERSRTDWPDLERRALAYALTDDERSIYDTVRDIDWMLSSGR